MPRVRGYFTEVILMSSLRIRSKYAVYTDALSSTHFTYDRQTIDKLWGNQRHCSRAGNEKESMCTVNIKSLWWWGSYIIYGEEAVVTM